MMQSLQAITNAQVKRLLNPLELAERMRVELLQPMDVPARAVGDLPGDEKRLLLAMPAVARDLSIAKVVSVRSRGGKDELSSQVLALRPDGSLLAIVDGEELTALRTAAASILAARLLIRENPNTLAVIGAGRQATALAKAFCAEFTFGEMRIWARRREAAEQLAAKFRDEVALVIVCDEPDQAVASADLITSATPSTRPLVRQASVSRHAHVDLVGGFRPDMREADDELIASSLVVADGATALAEAGDLVGPLSRGLIQRDDILLLADLLLAADRILPPDGPTVFKSVGHAGEDLIAVRLLLERMSDQSLG